MPELKQLPVTVWIGTAVMLLLAVAGAVLIGTLADPRLRLAMLVLEAGLLLTIQCYILIQIRRAQEPPDLRRLRLRSRRAEKALHRVESENKVVEAVLELTDAAKRTAEDTLGLRSAFLVSMTHEMRTPLNGVIGVAELLRRTRLDPEQAQLVELVRRSGDTLLALIDDVMDITRIENGQLVIDRQDFSLRDVLTRVVEGNRHRAEGKGQRLILSTRGALEQTVTGDPRRLRQVLHNLLTNAVKFSGPGDIEITAELDRSDASQVRFDFLVRDHGPGMTAAEQAQHFHGPIETDLFAVRRGGGKGLGLAITRSLCALMGAQLGVESIPGNGTAVSLQLDLPIADGAGTQTPTRETLLLTSPEMRPARRLHIGIAGADTITRRVIELSLCTLDVEPIYFAPGDNLVSARSLGLFDLLLVDMTARDVRTTGLIDDVRAAETAQGLDRTPIAALYADGAMDDSALTEKIDAALRLPLKSTELFAFIDRFLDRSGAEAPDILRFRA